eukprot:TRINITY_DN1733_c0_g1_i3.p1 TRINITY_DN1733_c0_g1~~TRINITY_DN1733_c0_g1_i3.p1  ORF type:complete len:247 (+),score=58.77 TRINITY_DN1733_c0_g1_i3:105-743(+)
MADTACYVDIFSSHDRPERISHLAWLFEVNFHLMYARDPSALRVWKANSVSSSDEGAGISADQVGCFFMFVQSKDAMIGLWEKISAGLLKMPFRCGFGTTQQLLSAAAWFESMEKEVMGDRPYLTLQRMVVSPKMQGLKIGSKCLQQALCEADDKSLPVFLATQSTRNVTFYSRLGFKLVKEAKFTSTGDPKNEYTSYFMTREPRTSESPSS